MNQVTAIPAVPAVRAPRPGPDRASLALRPATGTALVAVAPILPHERAWTCGRRPVATFVAQLIATRCAVPQTRQRRRAEPREALGAYAAAAARAVQPPRVARSA